MFVLDNSQLLSVPENIQSLIQRASAKLNLNGHSLFTSNGGEVDDVELIRDDETLYLCVQGECFRKANASKSVCDDVQKEVVPFNPNENKSSTSNTQLNMSHSPTRENNK